MEAKSTPGSATYEDKTYKKALRRYLKHSRQQLDHQWTPFRAAEKRFKTRFPFPSLHDVLDLSYSDPQYVMGRDIFGNADAIPTKPIQLRREASRQVRSYVIPQIPGLVILPNYLTPGEQRYWIKWSLCNQVREPNDTNLDIHYQLPKEGLWNVHVSARQKGGISNAYIIEPKRPNGLEASIYPPEGPRQLTDNVPMKLSDFHAMKMQSKPQMAPSSHLPPIHVSKLLPKLRWANIGHSYHWGSKSYDFTKPPNDFPSELRKLCKAVIASIDWRQVWEGVNDEDWGSQGPDWEAWPDTYEPDAGIVNFYQSKDTLCGHVDKSEICATSPLVSMSLGNAAIFLIGGVTRLVEPIPILLRSGDVMVMSGPSCRRAYHGVPRILENTLPEHFQGKMDDDSWEPFAEYLQTTRININVRQVFPRGFDPLGLP